MADPPTSSDTSEVSNQDLTTNTPRWVKVFGILAIVVALLFVVMLLAGGGRHGPSRHGVSDGSVYR
jgi:hypothetical protein